MGQKYSCDFDISRIFGRKRKRSTPSQVQALSSAMYFKSKEQSLVNASSVTNTTDLPCGSYLQGNSENPTQTIPRSLLRKDFSSKDDIRSISVPDFQIKDGTIILAPSKRNGFCTPNSFMCSSALLGVPNKRSEDPKNSEEEMNDKAYHHSLPYIRPGPTLNLDENDVNDIKQEKPDTVISEFSTISTRMREMNLDAGVVEVYSSKCESKLPTVPPEIPPRLFEKNT